MAFATFTPTPPPITGPMIEVRALVRLATYDELTKLPLALRTSGWLKRLMVQAIEDIYAN